MCCEIYDLNNFPFRIKEKDKILLVFNKEDFSAWFFEDHVSYISYITEVKRKYTSESGCRTIHPTLYMKVSFGKTFSGNYHISCSSWDRQHAAKDANAVYKL